MKKLQDILGNIEPLQVIGSTDHAVTLLRIDSRNVSENDVFFAIKGTITDGHKYIDTAIAKGAKSIICEVLPETIDKSVTYIKVNDAAYAAGLMASSFYDCPSEKLKLVGITGTNGKTTTATLLYRLFKELGYKVGLLSTVKNYIDGRIYDSTHTTPDPINLNALLKEMVDEGCTHCFMEVSSHSIDQKRIAGLDFDGGVFTNITHDHLDYHKTFSAYIKAKQKFFDDLKPQAFALTNKDDRNGDIMLQNSKAHKYSYALKSIADYKCKILENQLDGQLLNIDEHEVWTKLIGTFNAYNLNAIYATACLLGEDKLKVLTILSNLEAVDGRFEFIRSKNNTIGIVDYAHTPDALQNVLNTINQIRTGNESLITVVGCGGDRDTSKRPIMGRIASEGSNKVILTSDNPRSEDPEEIIRQMQAGVEGHNYRKVIAITNRREAIKTACMMSQPGDVILVAGKGHEKYQEINGVKHHFDDLEELSNLLLND